MELADIVRDRKVCVFLRPDLAEAVERSGAGELAVFGHGAAEGLRGRTILRPYREYRDVRNNNADVLILDGRSLMAGRRYRYYSQAEFVLVPAGARAPIAALFFMHITWRMAWRSLAGSFLSSPSMLAVRGTVSIETKTGTSRWIVLQNIDQRFRRRARRYIAAHDGLRPLFERLRDLKYCVLRWHGLLGDWRRLGDLDIMVHQDDLAEFNRRLEEKLGFFPADVYSAFRVSGHHLKGTAYLPPACAVGMLERAIEGGQGERRPTPRDTLSAFAYHLLFHKKVRRLGPGETLRTNTWKYERYHRELMRLADETGVPHFSTLQEVENYLRAEGWFPPVEMLKTIAKRNRFVRRRHYNRRHYQPGLIVFALRESAPRHRMVGEIERMIAEYGFEIVRSAPIPEDLRYRASTELRGGNWQNDDNGEPVHCIVAFDPRAVPIAPYDLVKRVRKRYRDIDNERVLLKHEIRRRIAAKLGFTAISPLHTSDNSLEALDYLRVVFPDLYEACRARVALIPDHNDARRQIPR